MWTLLKLRGILWLSQDGGAAYQVDSPQPGKFDEDVTALERGETPVSDFIEAPLPTETMAVLAYWHGPGALTIENSGKSEAYLTGSAPEEEETVEENEETTEAESTEEETDELETEGGELALSA